MPPNCLSWNSAFSNWRSAGTRSGSDRLNQGDIQHYTSHSTPIHLRYLGQSSDSAGPKANNQQSPLHKLSINSRAKQWMHELLHYTWTVMFSWDSMSRFLCLLNDAMQDISSNRSPLLIHFSVQSRHITTQNMTDQHFQSAKQLYIPTTITKK